MSPETGPLIRPRIATQTPLFITEDTGRYPDRVKQLRAALEWLKLLGTDLARTRFGHYLHEMESYVAALEAGAPATCTPRFYAASADGHVLIQAHGLLAGRYD